MENSVLAVSRPVVDRLPVNIDEFACRQLDRLGRYRRSSEGERGDHDRSHSPTKTHDVSMTSEESDHRRAAPTWLERQYLRTIFDPLLTLFISKLALCTAPATGLAHAYPTSTR
jgi:hypothetical protein